MKKIIFTAVYVILFSFTLACAKKEPPVVESAVPSCEKTKLENQYIVHWKNKKNTLVAVSRNELKNFLTKNKELIQFAEPNYSLSANDVISSNTFQNLNYIRSAESVFDSIHAPFLWQLGYSGEGVVVAVIDTGINLNHPQLYNRLAINLIESRYGENFVDDDKNGYVDDIFGWNFVTEKTESTDEHGHGTGMAGIITGSSFNRPSLSLAPQAKILPLDFMNESGGSEFHAQQAMAYAISRKVKIINNSWSINCSELLKDAFLSWQNENVIFVNASGNSPIDVVLNGIIPSSLELSNTLNVGSVDEFGQRSAFSGYGSTVKVYAPGEFIPTIYPTSGTNHSTPTSGTSVSTAIVSGAAALLWSAYPQATAQQIVNLIQQSANQEPPQEKVLDLKKAYYLGRDLFY